jgi:Flp pilus assembly protein TadD
MLKNVLLSGLSLLVLCGIAFGQIQQPRVPTEYTINGRLIFGNTSAPDDRIEVRLMGNSSAQVLQTAYSDSGGNFEFRGLQSGAYVIAIDVPDYEEIREPVQVVSFGGSQRVTHVSILLNRTTNIRRGLAGGLPSDDPDVIDVAEMQQNFPKKAVDEYKKAMEDRKKGDNKSALKRLLGAAELAPTFYQVHSNLGVIYQEMKQFRDAEREYRRAAELNPRSPQPLINLGSLFIEESDTRRSEGYRVMGALLDNAMDSLDDAIKLRPTSGTAHYYLGTAYYKSAFYEEAEVSLKKALDLEPSMSSIRLMLVNVYRQQNRGQDILDQLDAYLKENPKASNKAEIAQTRAAVAKVMEESSIK